jgi:hypothetical protein
VLAISGLTKPRNRGIDLERDYCQPLILHTLPLCVEDEGEEEGNWRRRVLESTVSMYVYICIYICMLMWEVLRSSDGYPTVYGWKSTLLKSNLLTMPSAFRFLPPAIGHLLFCASSRVATCNIYMYIYCAKKFLSCTALRNQRFSLLHARERMRVGVRNRKHWLCVCARVYIKRVCCMLAWDQRLLTL